MKNQTYRLVELEQNSPAWLEFRKGKIGGSDIPIIAEVDGAYKSRADLLHEKITGESKPVSEFTQKLFQEGHDWEPIIRDEVNHKYEKHFVPTVVQSVEYPHFFTSLDGFDEVDGSILEVKTTQTDKITDLIKTGIVPKNWYAQVQWQLFITNSTMAMVAALDIRTKHLHDPIRINRDEVYIVLLKEAAQKFYEEMSTAVSPYQQLESIEMRTIASTKVNIKEFQKMIDDAEDKIKLIAEDLLRKYKATKIVGCGVQIETINRQGNVDYSKIGVLKTIDLEKYRKKGSTYVKITELKPSKGKIENE